MKSVHCIHNIIINPNHFILHCKVYKMYTYINLCNRIKMYILYVYTVQYRVHFHCKGKLKLKIFNDVADALARSGSD